MLLKDCQSMYYITYSVWTNLGWDEPFANIEASLGSANHGVKIIL